MTERAAIEALITEAYAARCRGDLDGLMGFLHPECSYRLIGAPQGMHTQGHAALRSQMRELIETFVFSDVEPLAMTIEGDRVSYHWRAKATFAPNGRSEIFEIMDLVTVEGGKVKTVAEFTDTAGILRLTAPLSGTT